ncbi:MAG TPA: hypothetical protein P5232_03290 [Candidatus Moranbacteria bacterium]|nr:hypothetical protein [Candidatus Moranbacteria bacterium]
MLNKMDPIFLWLRFVVARRFFDSGLLPEENAFVLSNISKHRNVLWLNVVCSVFVYFSLLKTNPDKISIVITSLLAPVMVMGGAWFAISFGGIPAKLMDIAMSTTSWMFAAFSISLSSMFIAVGFSTYPLLWPVLTVIYIGALISCIQYDTADGLKAGLDEAVLKHSRAALIFYREKQGIDIK